jgi:predicted Holliday junction resolvase-like endonuclease
MAIRSEVLWFLKEQRHLFVICPCCGEVIRLSDARLSYAQEYADDWLDKIERKEKQLESSEEKINEKKKEWREKAVAKARKRILPQLLRGISPILSRLNIRPDDVRPILDPVDFIVFDGMRSVSGIKRIFLIDRASGDKRRRRVQESLKKTIQMDELNWETLRIADDGKIEQKKERRQPPSLM